MSLHYPTGFLTASYDPLRVPDAPTIGAATAGNAQVSLAFTAPTYTGKPATITSFTATSNTGISSSNTASPIVITGLVNNTGYKFTVIATNATGNSAPSAESNAVAPVVPPSPVINFLVVAGGGSGGMQGNRAGGGGGGGGLKSSFDVGGGPSGTQLSAFTATLATNYTVTVGAGGASTPAGSPQHGFQGTSSVFNTVTTTGGGGGGAISNYGAPRGAEHKDGGSSGGANGYENTPGTPVADQGYTGGTGSTQLTGYAQGTGGGGGGAGGVGGNGTGANGSFMQGGVGGNGKYNAITGAGLYYAGGGGGAATNFLGGKAFGTGTHGGGNGGQSDSGTAAYYGKEATVNTGGGGGGASQYGDQGSGWPGRSGAGGSGIVILRYASALSITVGAGLTATTASDGSSKVTSFTAGTGNVQWN